MEDFNTTLFLIINAGPGAPHPLILLATALATWVVYLAAAGLVVGWIRGKTKLRFALLDATLTALIALGVAQIIARLWYHPRPFELGLGRQLLAHVPETSFPSDHATLLFALALPLVLNPVSRRMGWFMLALGAAVAWSRVYLGVHFPFDMAGAVLVALASTLAVQPITRRLRSAVYPALERLYDWILTRLGLPTRWFPRRQNESAGNC
jgi:undecaprenyl-diphosphatase